jgi:hypothetical protein
MNAAMKNPVFHQGNLFIARGYEVLLYTLDDNNFVYQDSFPFVSPVEELKSDPKGLIVATSTSWDVIAGGSAPSSYFIINISDRVYGATLTSDWGVKS